MFYSVYFLAVSNSLMTVSFTSGKYLLLIFHVNFFSEIQAFHSFHSFIHMTYSKSQKSFTRYSLLGIVKIFYSVNLLFIVQVHLVKITNSSKHDSSYGKNINNTNITIVTNSNKTSNNCKESRVKNRQKATYQHIKNNRFSLIRAPRTYLILKL